MAVSNNITAGLNFVALLSSIAIIASGVWLASRQDNECIRLVRWPIILIGLLIFLVSLAGFVGAFWRVQCLLAVYLVAMIILIVLLLSFVVFAFVVTGPSGAYPISGRGYDEYRLQGYSAWLRHYVADNGNWNRVRACLGGSTACSGLPLKYLSFQDFIAAHLTPLQSGCCKPPTICGFGYVNPTVWINPTNPAADPDCYLWSNDQTQLCYSCNSCKAGLLGNLRTEWRKAEVALIVSLVALIWVYLIACSAFRNNQTEELFDRYKRPFT
ncbi:hypothetical protein AMTRI_Chr01g103460 [Amborella trichopoda]